MIVSFKSFLIYLYHFLLWKTFENEKDEICAFISKQILCYEARNRFIGFVRTSLRWFLLEWSYSTWRLSHFCYTC